MKRSLLFVMAIIVAASTFDYIGSDGYYGLVVVAGVIAAFFLIEKAMQ